MDVGLELSEAFLKLTEEMCRAHNISLTTLEEIPKETPMPESQEAPKLCKDCRWVAAKVFVCSHPKTPRSLLNGEPDRNCLAMRDDDAYLQIRPRTKEEATEWNVANRCGPEGRWWEAKGTPTKVRPDITLGLTAEERADFIDVLDKIRRWFQ